MSFGPLNRYSVSVLDYGAVADCVGNNPASGTDNTAAFQAAIAAACGPTDPYTGQRCGQVLVPNDKRFPLGSYRVGRLDIKAPVQFIGTPGAKTATDLNDPVLILGSSRAGSQITFSNPVVPAPADITMGILTGFNCLPQFTGLNGGSADGVSLFGLDIFLPKNGLAPTPRANLTNYAAGTILSVPANNGASSLGTNTFFYLVLVGGQTGATVPNFNIDCHVPIHSPVWTPRTPKYFENFVRRTDPTTWGTQSFYVSSPVNGAPPGVTGNVEPVWNTAPGATTNDGSVVWTSFGSADGIIVDGTCVLANIQCPGVCALGTKVNMEDCGVHNAQNAGLIYYGSAGDFGDAEYGVIKDVQITGSGVGAYLRGGSNKFVKLDGVDVQGTAPQGMGALPFGTFGTDANEHGIVENSFADANAYTDCTVTNCGGMDYLFGQDSGATSMPVNCQSASGRVAMMGACAWNGPSDNLVFWRNTSTTLAGPWRNGYGSSAVSMVGSAGMRNCYVDTETTISMHCILGVDNAFADDAPAALGFQRDPSSLSGDLPYNFMKYGGPNAGFYDFNQSNGSRSMLAVSGTQSPLGPGALNITHGFYQGLLDSDGSPGRYQFMSLGDWDNKNIRAGLRKVGDILWNDPSTTVAGGYMAQAVVTAGNQGPQWRPNSADLSIPLIAPGTSPNAQPAQVIRPTDAYILANPGAANFRMVFLSGVGDFKTGGVEPNWILLGIGATVVDNNATWQRIADAPALKNAISVAP